MPFSSRMFQVHVPLLSPVGCRRASVRSGGPRASPAAAPGRAVPSSCRRTSAGHMRPPARGRARLVPLACPPPAAEARCPHPLLLSAAWQPIREVEHARVTSASSSRTTRRGLVVLYSLKGRGSRGSGCASRVTCCTGTTRERPAGPLDASTAATGCWITPALAERARGPTSPTTRPAASSGSPTRSLSPHRRPRRRSKSLAITVRGGRWSIEHRLRNAGPMLWSGGAWALTCTAPREATLYRVPLGGGPPRGTWPRSWSPPLGRDPHLAPRRSADLADRRRDGDPCARTRPSACCSRPRGRLEMHDRARHLHQGGAVRSGCRVPRGHQPRRLRRPGPLHGGARARRARFRPLAPGAALTHVEGVDAGPRLASV